MSMKASGNGTPQQCVANLLRTIRGEVPYERLKGLDPTLIDRPSAVAAPGLRADVEWLLRTYEPRTDGKSVDLRALSAYAGQFAIDAVIANRA